MDPILLNTVQATTADTSGTTVAAPVADIAGAAVDIATDGRVALTGAAADTAVVAADARAAALADAECVAAAVDSAGDLYRRACRVRRHCSPHVPRSTCHFWL